nr:HNH endonuclease [Methylopila sp. 73B]
MPTRPPLHRPLASRSKRERDKAHDARRTAEQPWRKWYWTARWRKIAKAHLASSPLCVECQKSGRVTAASVCDHVVPHRGDETLFWQGQRQSLCASCHNGAKKRQEAQGLMPGVDSL